MVNPGVIIGPGFWETGSGTLFTTANKGYKFYPPGGTGFITVHDVVRIMVALMDSQIQNERFITVAENLTFKEILLKLSSSLNKKPPKIQLKYWQLEILRVGDVLKSAFTGKKRSLTKKSIHSMKHRDAYSSDKIKEFINFEFESLDPTIEYSCSHFLKENL